MARIDLNAKTVLITGAAGGIGSALARAFAARGAHLALADRDEDGLTKLADALDAEVSTHVIDLTERDAIGPLIDDALAHHGRLDVVVCNAGWTVHGPFSEMTLDQIDGVLEVDLRSVLHLVHHALPHFETGSHIVLVSSMAGFRAFPYQTTYSAAKHGVAGYGDALRLELASKDIGVTTLMPGAIATAFLSNGGSLDSESTDQMATLMQRWGTPPEAVAAAALRGIDRNRGRMRVGWDAHMTALTGWLMPPLLPAVLAWATRRQLLGRS
ncbi:MAG: SDR family oxidoreductase [Proteobacteria bacterium]|nr:SDR family oxidoreductase [Pseudomonadota bacterium]